MTSLYVLANDYAAIAAKISDSDYDEQTIRDTLEGASGEFEEKAISVACFYQNLVASSEAIKEAEKRMKDRRDAIDKKAESIKRYLFDSMKKTKREKIESPYFNIAIRKNPASVCIDDESKIPKAYMVTPPPPPAAPDKKAIKAAIDSGLTVEGCRLVHGERLEIK